MTSWQNTNWNNTQPIFIQIRQRLIARILADEIKEGDAIPSVRQAATDLSVNPLTVTRAYQSLVDLGIVEKRRGLGMFVKPGASATLLAHEREEFLANDWPPVAARIKALDLDINDLIRTGKQK
ncbi:MAG: GntR family transcriptional regulator [Alphaproteobacteria bacterium]|nr:GntR family transcriptional regulator [Alphaproteobacteria bacterium]